MYRCSPFSQGSLILILSRIILTSQYSSCPIYAYAGSVSGEAISSKRNGDESDDNNSKVMTTQKSSESLLSENEEGFDATETQEQYHDNADGHGPQFESYRNESKLRQYKLLLQSIELEKKLNLNHQEIFSLRESISHSLTDLPSSASIDIEKMAFEYVE